MTDHPLADDETALVVADRQTAGRGRGNHQWWTPEGVLALSLIVSWSRMGFSRETSSELSSFVVGAVHRAVVEQLAQSPGEQRQDWDRVVTIKEPNDIYVSGKKLVGILIESPNAHNLIIGVGINVNNDISLAPEELRNRITSIRDLIKGDTDMKVLATRLVRHILPNLTDC